MNPGILHNMPSADYHEIHALGASGLKKLAKSPLHYYATTLDPDRPNIEPTSAMKAGTLAHCILLEPAAARARYVQRPAGLDLRTKAGIAWAASVPAGVECVTADQLEIATRQAASIRALPEVAALLGNGSAEVSAFWTDKETGALCKCRPDFTSPAGDGVILIDAKTTVSASPKDFPRSVVNYGYAMQAVHYCDGYEQATGTKVLGMIFACVESEYPHVASAFMLPDEWLDMARRKVRALTDIYARCKASGVWPGYDQSIQLLSMPAWLKEDAA